MNPTNHNPSRNDARKLFLVVGWVFIVFGIVGTFTTARATFDPKGIIQINDEPVHNFAAKLVCTFITILLIAAGFYILKIARKIKADKAEKPET